MLDNQSTSLPSGLVLHLALVSVHREHGSCNDGPRDPTEYGKANISSVSIGQIMSIRILTSQERNLSMISAENLIKVGCYDLTVYIALFPSQPMSCVVDKHVLMILSSAR